MDRGKRIAAIALAHAPCSARDNVERYAEAMVRPSEAGNLVARGYYLDNPSPSFSTCMLAVLAWWRLAGCTEKEVVEPYEPGRAFADAEALASRFGALELEGLTGPLRAGDAVIITLPGGGDGHVMTCTTDQELLADPVATVEGGQYDGRGSTAIAAFTRTLRSEGAGRGMVWKVGSKIVWGVVRAARLPVPDDAAPLEGDPALASAR